MSVMLCIFVLLCCVSVCLVCCVLDSVCGLFGETILLLLLFGRFITGTNRQFYIQLYT